MITSDKSMARASDRLQRRMPEKVSLNKPLARFTTLRVGGPAAIYATADTLAELRLLMQTISDYELPSLILGRGSNVLISDYGFPGIVFQLGRDFTHVAVDGAEITSGAAVTLTSLAREAMRHNLDGLTFAVGIPGTVGAAVAVNAGAHGEDMGRIVKKITYYSSECRLRSAGSAELAFSYRSCRLPRGAVILEAKLALVEASQESIKARMENNWLLRKNNQPLDMPNAGSMFKNPAGDYAGRLIEAAGLKGKQIGGARVSLKHANFFVNTGKASALDFYLLMKEAASAVKERFGVDLEPEVRILGDWSYAAR